MLQTTRVSESAVAVLRLEIKGWRAKDNAKRLPAYRELAAAGIIESVPGSETEYRFTEEGFQQREEILRTDWERVERERYAPPDTHISDAARELLRGLAAGGRVEVTPANSAAYRELADARIMYPLQTFVGGVSYRFTYWGWEQRFELAGIDRPAEVVDS
jgi:hypothetical protein